MLFFSKRRKTPFPKFYPDSKLKVEKPENTPRKNFGKKCANSQSVIWGFSRFSLFRNAVHRKHNTRKKKVQKCQIQNFGFRKFFVNCKVSPDLPKSQKSQFPRSLRGTLRRAVSVKQGFQGQGFPNPKIPKCTKCVPDFPISGNREIGPRRHPKSTDFTLFYKSLQPWNHEKTPKKPRGISGNSENFVVGNRPDISGISGNPRLSLKTPQIAEFHLDVHTAAAGKPKNPWTRFRVPEDISGSGIFGDISGFRKTVPTFSGFPGFNSENRSTFSGMYVSPQLIFIC
jgi:hypothetical protein